MDGVSGTVEAMAVDPAGDFLVVWAGATNTFSKVQAGAWTTTTINPGMAMADVCTGIDFLSDGNLYGVVWGDDRYQINPATGATLGFYSGVHRDWADMTSVPVPEPSPLVLCGAGALVLLACGWRRRRGR